MLSADSRSAASHFCDFCTPRIAAAAGFHAFQISRLAAISSFVLQRGFQSRHLAFARCALFSIAFDMLRRHAAMAFRRCAGSDCRRLSPAMIVISARCSRHTPAAAAFDAYAFIFLRDVCCSRQPPPARSADAALFQAMLIFSPFAFFISRRQLSPPGFRLRQISLRRAAAFRYCFRLFYFFHYLIFSDFNTLYADITQYMYRSH